MPIYPALRYHDARAAIDWLGEAFGFTEKEVHADDDGTIVHAELNVPSGGVAMLSSEAAGGDPRWGERAGKGWTYVVTDDPDGVHASAIAAGAELVMGLFDTGYGSRDFSVRDPEGNIWSFGTYAPE